MRQAFRDMSITSRLWLGFGTVLLLAGGSGAALWMGGLGATRAASAEPHHVLAAALGLSAALIAIGMVRWISRGLQKPLAQAMTAVQSLAQGDLTYRLKIERLDETGRLLVALDDLTNYLAVMMSDDDDGLDDASPHAPPMTAELDQLLDWLTQVCAEIEDRVQADRRIASVTDTAAVSLMEAIDGVEPAPGARKIPPQALRLLQLRAEQLQRLSSTMLARNTVVTPAAKAVQTAPLALQ